MLTLEEAIKQYEHFLNVCENHNLTEESQEVIEQLAAELRELQESKKVDSCKWEGVKEFDKRYLLAIKQLAAWLRELAERRKAPEIVHCGECRHRDPEDKKCDCGHDIIWQLPRGDNWYCADAERRTNDQARC